MIALITSTTPEQPPPLPPAYPILLICASTINLGSGKGYTWLLYHINSVIVNRLFVSFKESKHDMNFFIFL